ncbi:peroxiredoxin [Dichotomicrobium thermohalophilum]|uniref:Glutathione-dependent peroxiredoxin n=1 Tax=Dichotomicrobium thermohalophilum TaxID=933063 RepID=A0A397Q5Q8_9HYPH|nr:peroxiredoxin [Dichotomicrobium thermohalophilum]RIA56388.1 peroxiredoxin [Dichotomicrobium thermohalophilum]
MIAAGDRIPEATFHVMTAEGPSEISSDEVFSGKRVVLFAVPGAYTPTCHMKHLPGFIQHADDFKAKGIDTIACTAVNDPFVLKHWAKETGAEGKVMFLADGNASFAKAIGADFDGSGVGLGTRSKRYAMLVDDGVVKTVHVEDSPAQVTASSAETLLQEV